MKIRDRIMATLVILFIIFMISFYFVSYKYLLGNIKENEKENLKNKLNEISMSLDIERDNLRILTGDWAIWDDTYEFVKHNDNEYKKNNLDEATLNNLKIDIFLLYDNDDNLLISKVRGTDDSFVKINDGQIKSIEKYFKVLLNLKDSSDEASGLTIFNGKPMLISSRAVTDSIKSMPKNGTLIMGKYIENEMINRIDKMFNCSAAFIIESSKAIPENIKNELKTDDVYIEVQNKNKIIVYKKLYDVLNNTACYLVVENDRIMYLQGLNSIKFYIIFLSVICVTVIIFFYFFISKNIIRPIENISEDLREIALDRYDKGLDVQYENEELSKLSEDINRMLSKIYKYNKDISESEKKLNMVLEGSNSGYFEYDIEYDILNVSDKVFEILGYKKDEFESVSIDEWKKRIHPEDYNHIYGSFKRMIMGYTYDNHLEYRFQTKNNEYKWVYTQGKIVEYLDNNSPKKMLGIIMDIEDKKHMEKEIKYLTYYDKLTGLFNRGYYDYLAEQIISHGRYPISVIICDINGLKLINDSLGHEAGDKFIKETAKIIKSSCPEEAVICRWGGDEFIVLLENCDEKEVDKISQNIKNDIEQNVKYDNTLSIGYATLSSAIEDINILTRQAEKALYKNKLLNKKSIYNNTLILLSRTLFEKSSETEEHADRMVRLCEKMGAKLNFSTLMINELSLLAKLHDIGKIGIPDDILNKPSKLSDAEFEIIKSHTKIGYRIVSSVPDFENIAYYILCHHERYDGKGYPNGLKGEEIPLLSRIISIVDSFDVMTHERPYKKAISEKEAIDELKRCSKTQFDPNLVDVFVQIANEEKII
ncbi:PAS domain S-box-containing protein/diguanylate cyclase (GGDEF) domain-containing protein [Caloramator quimbayensis]|uniref:PAS domain S-box-containing protein/diguanylate cyclase (GGDEF) domain-containing protein n=1 Tax=Caloramator quimbayensis TaxID=1147123 RepID=A0A1T4Y8B9_9CLOT|nr:HD domain-containing phosphohydrolase [Caloramator quimbayensis]SKA98029.1 PAS domain S-box-containing protein/diguanylate cyclase (GGDEF) domain-containing protein [Caloramator quimbayensis]